MGQGVGRERWVSKGHKEIVRVMDTFIVFIVVMVMKVHTYAKLTKLYTINNSIYYILLYQ